MTAINDTCASKALCYEKDKILFKPEALVLAHTTKQRPALFLACTALI